MQGFEEGPDRPLLWDQPAVYRKYQEITGGQWDWNRIYQQIIKPYDAGLVGQTHYFDQFSIMMYPFPEGLAYYIDGNGQVTGSFQTGWNRELSALDKQFIATMYPK
jgi:hypothetical protein